MKLRLLFLTFLFSALSWGQSIIISQYIETSSGTTPKGIEIFNISGADIDFSVDNFIVHQGTNGAACSSLAGTSITSGILKADEVWVVGTSDLTAYAISNGTNLSGTTTFAFDFNGDDALQIYLGGVLQDQFGICGSDPGSSWTGGGVSTANNNIQIFDGLCVGDTDGWTDPSERFTQIAGGTVMTGFGNAPASCSGPITYSVTYDGNGNDSGSVPVDGNAYNSGDPVTVLGNTGSLGLTGFTFNGWNTAANGSGTSYVASDIFNITANTTLYAQWVAVGGSCSTIFSDDFSGMLAQWSNTADWTIASGELKNDISGVAGSSYTYADIGSQNLTSSDYEWQFCMRNGNWDPSGSNYFVYYLISSNTDVSSNASGYAVGFNATGTSDLLTLYSVNNGTHTAILTSTFDWNANDDVCIRVTRSSAGVWELFYNPNGSGELSAGTISDTTFTSGQYTGTYFEYTATRAGLFWLDDINICGGTPIDNEIDVEGNGVSIVNGDNTPSLTDNTDFGTTLVGNDVSHTFTITNAGPDDLDISGITITGVDAADFYISVNPASIVAAGGSTTFEVTFSPAAAGTSNATINIANNDSDENPYTFDIVAVSTVCTPTTSVSSITPTSGPVGTVVTINGSGFTTAASVSISGVSASFTIVSNTVIEVIVPAITASGNIVIQDAGGCDLSYSSFTLISEDNSSCEGIAVTTDLIIYDLHDEFTGNGGFITLYNGTAVTVDLTNYSIWRTSNYGDGNEIDYANLTGTLAPGALGVIRVNVAGCGPAGTNGTIDNGFNGDDQIQLRNAAGTVVIDDVHTYFDKGYYMVRNTGALSARTTFVAADWNTTPLIAGQCWPSAGLVPPSGAGNSPSVTLNPVDVNAGCPTTTATLTVSGSEGVVGGVGLAYQWYVNIPGNAGWTAVSNGGVYSGATSATLNISSTSGLNNYQYYCQIRENDATCYTATEAAIIKDGATVWNGSVWSNGVPDITKLATIDGDYDTAVDGSFSCCSLFVNATYTLDIQAVDYVEIQYNLTVNGTLNVWDDGSLVQVDDSGVNVGNINYERITTGVALDYVYWSSPVNGVTTPATGYVYTWNPTFANPNGGWGYWIGATNTSMAPGVGYIMRDVFSRTFTGVPRNGVIQPTISRANYTGPDFAGTNTILITRFDDNWNLVGNPYPSAISALDFLNANPNIEGAVRIWTHGTSPATSISDPVYDDYVYNYTVNDYIVYNGTGTVSGPAGFNGFIAGGQSFMINMNDGASATETVTFNNSMRNRTHNNEQFYKQTSPTKNVVFAEEKHRIWLDLADANNNSVRTLVGYVSGATTGKDRLYDAVSNAQSNEMNIFSIINDERMLIQGRGVPFDVNDKVQLSVNIPSTGLYSIGLSAFDGLFLDGQDIYIEDIVLNIIFDIKQMPYTFYAEKGEFKNRFVLRFTNETLGIEDIISEDSVVVFSQGNNISISSENTPIKSVAIYNLLGQLLFKENNVNSNNIVVSKLIKNSQALIVKVHFDNNKEITRKIVF